MSKPAPIPHVGLAHLPTPLEPLINLSKALGGPRIWVKRDDATGLAMGGNKARKLEYLMADAAAQDARTHCAVDRFDRSGALPPTASAKICSVSEA